MFRYIGFTDIFVLAAVLTALYRIRKSLPGSGLRAWHERHASPSLRTQWHRVLVLEFTELLLAGVFLLLGGAKLIGRPDMVALFHDIGVGQWFRYVTGTLEVTGAALLVVPLFSGASAILLGSVMIVATLIELFVLHRPPVAALACLSAHTFVAWAKASHRYRSSIRRESSAGRARTAPTRAMESRWTFVRGRRTPMDGDRHFLQASNGSRSRSLGTVSKVTR
jgi:putative oxidoreductase